MYNVIDTANYFNSRYREINIHPTVMQLLAICYLAQAWSLGINGKPIFYNKIDKWDYGMVIKDLYTILKVFGSQPINLQFFSSASSNTSGDIVSFTEKEKYVLDLVFNSYKDLTSFEINNRTKDNVYFCTSDHAVVNTTQLKMYYNHLYNSL